MARAVFVLVVLVALLAAIASARFSAGPFSAQQSSFLEWTCSGKNPEHCVDLKRDDLKMAFGKTLKRVAESLSDVKTLHDTLKGSRSFLDSFASWGSLFASGSAPSLTDIARAIRQTSKKRPSPKATTNASYPYFAWIPMPMGDALPNGEILQFTTPCFGSVIATLTQINASYAELTVTTANQLQFLCSDAYLLVGGGSFTIQEFDAENTYTVGFNTSSSLADTAQQWYYQKSGVRFLKFRDGLLDVVGELIDTITLLIGFMESPLPNATFAANIEFIQNYIQASPRLQPLTVPRTGGDAVALGLNPDYIQSGDALFVLRPDGLDPMIGWGEGDTVGHSTIALRINGTLNVCESTTKDAYWPTNGIQCHEFTEWIQLCVAAQHNVVHVPLSPEFAAKFDSAKALDFFLANEGLDYGFQVFLFGWLDLNNKNFPCVPDDYTVCLTNEVAETLAVLLDRVMGSTPENIFRQALQHRVNTWPQDTSVIESFYIAGTQMNQNFTDLYTAVEKDDWLYNTTRNGEPAVGKAMVCCVFVCNMWKAAGVFGNLTDQIQCGEQTLWDIFSMQIFDDTKMGTGRPAICQQYDPDNQLCQLTGEVTVNLKPDLNTRPLYANMGERCSSQGPNYVREPGC